MTTLCMWLMFGHGMTVGLAAVGAWLHSGRLRWYFAALVALGIFNAATLKADAQAPKDPRWPQLPATVEVVCK